MTCPKCASEHHKSRRVTSLGGAGKIKKGRTVHGLPNPLRDHQKSGRNMDVEFNTPFDDQGRCHHHPRVQMATKKVRGGWKILMPACPKCIEAKYDEDCSVASSKSGGSRSSRRSKGRDADDGSVSSRSSKRSVTSRNPPALEGAKFDKNGCCTKHPCLQIAKKKLLGGWKEFRSCPKCLDPSYDDMSEVASVSSKRSTTSFRSTGSRKSTRSVRSNSSRKGGRKTDRYGMLPFDEEGYCHAHPSVRIAKKKALGGWKVIHDICPDCAIDASSNAGSTRSRGSSRKSSGTGRYYDDSGSDASSFKSDRSANSSRSSRKVKIRVKAMKYQDENGVEGRYTGDVNDDHQPHGQGKIKYKDGTAFDGVWSEGSQVHGKSYRAKSSRSGSSGKKKKDDWSSGRREGEGGKKVVKRMKWLDYYGDPGEYTGEVDSSGMPDGKGSMKYDHGLIQDGNWKGGQFVEGSDEEVGKKKSNAKAKKSSRRKEP